jgi:hypothetical protein
LTSGCFDSTTLSLNTPLSPFPPSMPLVKSSSFPPETYKIKLFITSPVLKRGRRNESERKQSKKWDAKLQFASLYCFPSKNVSRKGVKWRHKKERSNSTKNFFPPFCTSLFLLFNTPCFLSELSDSLTSEPRERPF